MGSDPYAGSFDADRYYFFNLPGQHVLQAAAIRLAGAGVAQALWVSVLAALAPIRSVGVLGWPY